MKCPTCESPSPSRHPATQFEGEVTVCRDPFHTPTAQTTEDAAVTRERAQINLEAVKPFRRNAAGCEHEWHIWPETDGLEQRCMKCGKYRRTPAAERIRPYADSSVVGQQQPRDDGGWQPIETAPRDYNDILCYSKRDLIHVMSGNSVHEQRLQHGASCNWTHWMPLPPAPLAASEWEDVT